MSSMFDAISQRDQAIADRRRRRCQQWRGRRATPICAATQTASRKPATRRQVAESARSPRSLRIETPPARRQRSLSVLDPAVDGRHDKITLYAPLAAQTLCGTPHLIGSRSAVHVEFEFEMAATKVHVHWRNRATRHRQPGTAARLGSWRRARL